MLAAGMTRWSIGKERRRLIERIRDQGCMAFPEMGGVWGSSNATSLYISCPAMTENDMRNSHCVLELLRSFWDAYNHSQHH